MTSLTLIRNDKGDFALHVTGCSDIKRSGRPAYFGEGPTVHTGSDLLAALIAVDTDAAGWFACDPYTEKSRTDGCWAVVNGINTAPCVNKRIKAAGITFDADGRPVAP